jgi:hypothetical protein
VLTGWQFLGLHDKIEQAVNGAAPCGERLDLTEANAFPPSIRRETTHVEHAVIV